MLFYKRAFRCRFTGGTEICRQALDVFYSGAAGLEEIEVSGVRQG